MRRNLVIARIGSGSLHEQWLDGDRLREWDLVLCPYQPTPFDDDPRWTTSGIIPGPKWSGLRTLLNGWDGWRGYERIWLPDDDLLADSRTIDRMFAIAAGAGLELFAPALDERSYYAHFSTMRNPRFHGRWTGFVEIMMPGFTAGALAELLPTLDLSTTGWGWGLDSLWPKLLGYRDVGIIDATPVLHTRPVGAMRDAELRARVLAESDRILAAGGCRQEHRTLSAFGADLGPLPLSPEALLAELVHGWRYLIDRDPRIHAWIADYQRPATGWIDYPVEGTPAGPAPLDRNCLAG